MQMLPASLDAAAGLLVATLLEYVHHRWGGHARALGERVRTSHQLHHGDPLEGGVGYGEKLRQRAPLIAGASAVLLAGAAAIFGPRHAAVVILGVLAGYAYIEGYHHRMHHRPPTTAFGRWMRRHHHLHHFVDSRANYGFSSPLWDVVFRTRRDGRGLPSGRVERAAG